MGRPLKNGILKNKLLHINLDEPSNEKLERLCLEANTSKAEAIRRLIMRAKKI